jgi:enoyl-CoA hydratase
MSSEQFVKFEKHGHIGIFTLDRPKAMNAVNGVVSQQFENHLTKFEADEDLWVGIVCSSHKKVFCAGADLGAIGSGVPLATVKGGFAGFVQYPRRKPMIAAVDGFALAGGCEIVLACDMVVASENSRFGVPEVKRSLVAAAGGLFRLPQKIPKVIAMEMILTGDRITANRAYELGFVNKVVPKGESLQEAIKLAQRITCNAPLAVREAKAATDAMFQSALSDKDAFDRSNFAMAYLSKTADFREGPKAFMEKRPAKWTGKAGAKADAWLIDKLSVQQNSKL